MVQKVYLSLSMFLLSFVVSCATNPFENHTYYLMDKGKIERDTLEQLFFSLMMMDIC
jgi:hypothetical protein